MMPNLIPFFIDHRPDLTEPYGTILPGRTIIRASRRRLTGSLPAGAMEISHLRRPECRANRSSPRRPKQRPRSWQTMKSSGGVMQKISAHPPVRDSMAPKRCDESPGQEPLRRLHLHHSLNPGSVHSLFGLQCPLRWKTRLKTVYFATRA